MATTKQMKEAAKAAGLTGYSKLSKDELEALLAANGVTVDDDETAAAAAQGDDDPVDDSKFAPIGYPNEPEDAGLTDNEKLDTHPRVKDEPIAGPDRHALDQVGVPTEPEKAGLNEIEKRQLGLT